MIHARTALIIVATAAGLAAQSVATFPSDHASVANGASSSYWFPYSNGISRQMAVYESWDLNIPNGHQITRIGFRQDGSTASTGKSLQLEVRMGRTLRTASNLLSNFDNNYSTPPTTVFGPALFTLPNLTNSTTGSQVWLDLTTPFTFDASENLLVEWRVTANSNGNASFSYYLDRASFVSDVTAGPSGCPHSGGQTPTLASSPTAIGSNWNLALSRAPSNSFVFLLLAVNGRLVTPYPLTPFNASISPACTGQLPLNFLIVTSAVTSSGGASHWSFPVPNQRLFWNDVFISSQAAILDLFSPGGIVVSNGDQIQFGIEPAMSILTSSGSATATTGSVYTNHGVVTLFQHQ